MIVFCRSCCCHVSNKHKRTCYSLLAMGLLCLIWAYLFRYTPCISHSVSSEIISSDMFKPCPGCWSLNLGMPQCNVMGGGI